MRLSGWIIFVCRIMSLQPDPGWIEHYNWEAPHSTLGMQSSAEFYAEWIVKSNTGHDLSKIKSGSTKRRSRHVDITPPSE